LAFALKLKNHTMRKNFLTLAFLLLSTVLFAQYQSPVGHLTVFCESGERFFMFLNGELQNETSQSNIRIEDLNQKYYSVKIQFEDKTLSEIIKNSVMVSDLNGVFSDVTYKIRVNKNRKTRMNFFSSVPVIENFIPPSNVYVIHGNPNQTPTNVNNGGINIGGINVNINSPNSNQGSANPQGRVPQENPQTQYKGCVGKYEMSNRDFDNGIMAINKETFDSDKKKTMNQIISNNCLSTNQISVLMKRYTFDSDRLAIAKFAVDYCVDPKNYYQLNALFTFSQNKDELINYVQSKRF
jgi:Domain of unknown function (DUF4476)